MESSQTVNGRKIRNAAIISISMLEDETFDSMREQLNYLFKDVTLTENAREIESTEATEKSHKAVAFR